MRLRTFFPTLSLILLAAVVSAPVPMHAQSFAQAAHFSPATALAFDQPRITEPTAGKKETTSQEEQEEKFRHSPTVEWFAKLLNLDVERTAEIFEYINFAVIFLAVGIPLVRFIPKVLRKRKARLSADIEVAQARTADANDRLDAVEKRLAGLDAEISTIRKQVEEDMRADEARSKAAIEEETARIVAAAEQEIVMAGTQAQRGLRQFAANLAIDRALSTLTLDAETDRALIADFAAGLNAPKRKSATKGDQN